MILTLFYAGATLMQSWRLRSITSGIANRIRDQCTVSFYRTCTEGDDGFTSIGASSEVCDNYKNGRVIDTVWYHNMSRGVTILPKQHLALDKWVTFTNLPSNLNPLLSAIGVDVDAHSDQNIVHILLETNTYPDLEAIEKGASVISAEHFGMPIAWKIDSNLTIVLKSNVTLFIELIKNSFIHDTLFINNYLPIIRIESVSVSGTPLQLLDFEASPIHLKQTPDPSSTMTETECRHHIDKLKILNLVANLKGEPSPDDYEKDICEDICVLIGDEKPVNGNCVSDTAQADSIHGDARLENGVVEWIKSVETDASQLEAIARISPSLSPAKTDTSPVNSNKLGNGNAHRETPVPNKGSQDLVSVQSTDEKDGSDDVFLDKATVQLNDIVVDDQKTMKTCNSSTSECHSSQFSTLKRKKRNSDGYKPPNVLVYSESNDIRTNVISTIRNILHPDRYTIYELKTEQLKTSFWLENTTLLIVCGPISAQLGPILMEYFLSGGKMLCLCSDVINMVLPIYRTAEVRESELVQFSYSRWHKIKLMHHIFCYHPSPIKKHFSLETEDHFDGKHKPMLTCPGSIDLKDHHGDIHRLEVKVLGTEETWNTPSLILAKDTNCKGKAVFSQVHLDADPNVYEHDDIKFRALTISDTARLEIFSDLLSTQLGLIVQSRECLTTNMFPNAYFLGRHEAKFELLEKLKPQFIHPNTLKTNTLIVKFYGKNETPKAALENTLPVLLHSCPDDFSTIAYFDTLKSREIGRLVIYAPVISSTMALVANLNMRHGLAVIGRKQTSGVGRNKNQWLSPAGCALFSLQLHIPLSTPLGQKLPLLQHLVSVAVVNSIRKHEHYKKLDIRLKWPNDIFANGNTKIGGIIANTELTGDLAVCNIGVGFNLDNSIPTTCVNDLIKTYNLKNNTDLPYLEYEPFFANVFNEIEHLTDIVQKGDFGYLYDLYYKLWLHSDAKIVIIDAEGNEKLATIIGIDDYGYLLVKQPDQEPESVHPDGNTFDILRGLISAKHY